MLRRKGWVMFAAGVAAGIATTGLVGPLAAEKQDKAPGASNPRELALESNLYMQHGAEYRACCLQAYRLAADRLRGKLTAGVGEGVKPPAVVLDLDETVLDNGCFQSFLDRERLNYEDSWWDQWEENWPEEVRLVPGAAGFLELAERSGVKVFFITNRHERFRSSTLKALQNLGIAAPGVADRLLLKTDTSDKTRRRRSVEKDHRVLLYVGDQLRDFSEEFIAAKDATTAEKRLAGIASRNAKVDARAARFGDDWIVLPNPSYGEWQKLHGSDPRSMLRPTKMAVKNG
ncbi:MAG TPA: HAD family acid phosphatase [Planctomycetia bacterium]|nr:HAD family acid phosphatase [Planctomycetia bacterium]